MLVHIRFVFMYRTCDCCFGNPALLALMDQGERRRETETEAEKVRDVGRERERWRKRDRYVCTQTPVDSFYLKCKVVVYVQTCATYVYI